MAHNDNDDYVDVDVKVLAVGDRAIRVTATGNESDAVWLPKSQCRWVDVYRGLETQIEVRQWLAEREGLI